MLRRIATVSDIVDISLQSHTTGPLDNLDQDKIKILHYEIVEECSDLYHPATTSRTHWGILDKQLLLTVCLIGDLG